MAKAIKRVGVIFLAVAIICLMAIGVILGVNGAKSETAGSLNLNNEIENNLQIAVDKSYTLSGTNAQMAETWNEAVKYSKDNGGASSARNFGIKKSSGDYIMFIDADDYISSNCLELFVNNLKEDIDCIFGRLNRVDNLNNIINISQEETKPQIFEEQQIIELRKNLLQEFLPKIDYFRGPVCKLYRKSIILENDIQFDEKTTHGTE